MKPAVSWGLAAATAFALVWVHEGTLARIEEDFAPDQARDLGGMSEVRNLIEERWVERPEEGQLLDGALRGMVATLDRYSDYISPEEKAEFEESTTGQYGGLGIYISVEDGLVHVIAPIEDTPAWRAGILPGDTILEVDGVPCEFPNAGAAVRALKGLAGTTVALTVLHEGAERPERIEIERAIVQIRSVKGARLLDPQRRIGYLRLTTFNSGTVDEFEAALAGLLDEGLRALIVDLRGNPGGLLDAAVEVADAFLEEGRVIVTTRGREGDTKETRAEEEAWIRVPVALLIDRGSASASEILAGALKDHRRALLVGTRSFGKGSVQTILPILGGEAELKLTTQYYFTPSGRRIHRGDKPPEDLSWGLLPDIEVTVDPATRRQLLEAQAEDDMERLKARANGTPYQREERLHRDDPQVRAAYEALLAQLGKETPGASGGVAPVDSRRAAGGVAATDDQGR
ncbi:MAG: S41 family peptidase [Planctomycetota bacterium]|nr:MAG: S41 family peptidase [Planctomycetota bacterium]